MYLPIIYHASRSSSSKPFLLLEQYKLRVWEKQKTTHDEIES